MIRVRLEELREEADNPRSVPSLRAYTRTLGKKRVDEWMAQFEKVYQGQVEAAQGAGEIAGKEQTIAIDGTDNPFYPQTKTETDDSDAEKEREFDLPDGVVGTKKSHHTNYAYKWLSATIVQEDRMPKVAAFPLKSRKSNHFVPAVMYLVERCDELVGVKEVLMDSEFRDVAILKWLDDRGTDFVVAYPRIGDIKDVMIGWNGRYGASKHKISPEKREAEVRGTLFGQRLFHGTPKFDTKQLSLADFEDEDGDSAPEGRWLVYFTNKDGITAENAVEKTELYGHRFTIEANYRVLKHNFVANTATPSFDIRAYYWLFGVMFYNNWVLHDYFLRGDYPELAPGDRPVEPAHRFGRRFLRSEIGEHDEGELKGLFHRLI